MKLSGIVIVKNEEKMILDCLNSISFCDEIIVVDGGSTDNTVKLSKGLGAKVFECRTDDFSQMRNEGLKHSTGDWVLYVDADERVTPELRDEIKTLLSKLKTGHAAYKIHRKNFYLGNNEWPYIEKLERLFKRDSLRGWHGKLHESPIYEGKIGELNNFLLHYTHRNLSEMLEKTIKWSTIEAKLRYDAGHPRMKLWRFPRVCFSAFYNSYIKQSGWKAGAFGLIESIYQSFSMFITYAKLWEMQNKNQK